MANPHPFATVNHICLALGIPYVSRLHGELVLPKAALLYALGYRDELREEGFSEQHFSDEDIDRFMKRMMEQPAKAQIPALPNLMDGPTVELHSTILGCSVVTVASNNDQSIYLAEALLGAVEAFFATSLDQRILTFRSDMKIVVRPSDAISPPFTISEERAEGSQYLLVQHPPGKPDRAEDYRQKYRDTMMKAIGRILTHISVLDDAEKYFEGVAGAERGFSRALIFSEVDIASEKIFGEEPRLGLTSLLIGDEASYPLKRERKWSEGIVFEVSIADEEEDQELSLEDGLGRFSDLPHSARKVVSLIDVPRWNRARWSATMYATDPNGRFPPILGLGFEDIAVAREIFHELRAKLGNADRDNKLRVAILTGVDKSNPASYNVVISTNLDENTKKSNILLMMVSRVNQMTPRNTANSDRFLSAVGERGIYIIAPAHFDGNAATLPMPEIGIGIEKSAIIVRPAWQVGRHDEDAAGISEDDDPIIPDGEDSAPILETLKARRQRSSSASRP
jgi:hypothetical protein